jgi:hypothetical protein
LMNITELLPVCSTTIETALGRRVFSCRSTSVNGGSLYRGIASRLLRSPKDGINSQSENHPGIVACPLRFNSQGIASHRVKTSGGTSLSGGFRYGYLSCMDARDLKGIAST